ncbi:GTP cyclohydrolase III (methanopterin) [Candidatus Nitrosotalea sp. TS]|uniref:tetratricopeptide repeat protein n=1 Tax=Candidatus Nitrosotalea sp. TS TaxID=2341020 RepID=UPI00140AD6C2|nr:tetratricopeptide repeat protein [Candidatus Nitrosotalea sp. TS]NHI02400.1 GTP cyclohydrolase III (methanopterin) [Candidatus Nitrosotalea sp. TS]
MKKLFKGNSESPESTKIKPEMSVERSKESKITDPNYTRDKLYKKGVSLMADEKMDDAVRAFEGALQVDPGHVDSLLKLGYARFHMGDLAGSMDDYNKVHEIDVTNSDAWNLKGLIYYRQKNYEKALECVEKSIDTNPTDGMSWYNKGCYYSLLNHIPEAIEALKRSIEIDVKNAKKAVRDKDFENVRADDGYRRIVEVVVLESVRQGYHKVGQIVWTTMLGKTEVEDAARKLVEKGLLIKEERNVGLSKVEEFEIAPELAAKIGVEKKGLFGTTKKINPLLIQHLKEISEAVHAVKTAIEKGDVEEVIAKMDVFIDPSKRGAQMIEHFFEEHRDIRLFKIRLTDKGYEYLQANKQKMIDLFDHIESQTTKKLRSETTQNT